MTYWTRMAALAGSAAVMVAGAATAHPTDGQNDLAEGISHALSHGEHLWSLAGIVATLIVAGVLSFKLLRKDRQPARAKLPQDRK